MPIYEWQCLRGHRFELLSSSRSVKSERCPQCSSKSSRVISTFAIHGGAEIATSVEMAARREIDVTDLKIPTFARPCGMDDYSAARFAAYKVGRGAEFDDKTEARKEKTAASGVSTPQISKPRKPKHTH